MKINGNEIVKYIYDTGAEKFEDENIEDTTMRFVNWINENTNYRGLLMYAKHIGYHLIYEDKYTNRYIRDGLKTYQIDEYGNLLKEV